MILTLEVLGEQAEDLGAGSSKVFDSIGGTIGRLPDNDWVFPDPYVSGRHALIRYLNGKFFVEDTSTNGVFINSPDTRVSRSQPHQLKHGDTIYIDAYRIQVSIEKPNAGNKLEGDPFELLKAHSRNVRNDKTVAMLPPEDDRTESMMRKRDAEPAVEWFQESDADDGDNKEASRAPPPAAAPAKAAKRTAPTPVRETPVTRDRATPKPAATSDASDALIREMMSAAGIQGVEPSAELAQTLGAVLRVAVGGLMDVLRARERMKDDMRLRGTTFKIQHNNPLKFSANVDDAFHNLLVKHNPAYLSPPDAFEDALRDVRDHQAAIIASMRLAFETMLAKFDPTRLQEDFDRQMKKGSILGVPAKLRYWDLYREKYGEMVKDAEGNFRTLFAEEFAKAYEEQLERLQALARSRPK
jgi:type VI secretion system FHA domain protein